MKKLLILMFVLAGFGATAQSPFLQGDKGNLFTKNGVIWETDFSKDSLSVEWGLDHTIESPYGDWVYAKDTMESTFTDIIDREVIYNYVLGSQMGVDNKPRKIPFAFKSPTNSNGYIVMSPLDNGPSDVYSGAKNLTGTYNTSVQINNSPFSTQGVDAVQVSFYQLVSVFNYDKFYIEWSTDKSTWDSLQINVLGIDYTNTGVGHMATKTVTLPLSAANKDNLYLRFRYFSPDSSHVTATQGLAGYYWLIDDLKVSAAPASKLSVAGGRQATYYTGVYHTIPEGLSISPIRWSVAARSEGSVDETNVQASITNINIGDEAKSRKVASMDITKLYNFNIDHFDTTTIQNMSLYTEEIGTYDVTSNLISDSTNIAFDTLSYNVIKPSTSKEIRNKTVWAADNGQIAKGTMTSGTWTYGIENNGIKNEWKLCVTPQYTLCVSYQLAEPKEGVKQDTVYANGVQMVLSPASGYGGIVLPMIFEDTTIINKNGDTAITSVLRTTLDQKASHVIKSTEINPLSTTYINDPIALNLPVDGFVLKPGSVYKACYRNSSSGLGNYFVGRDGVKIDGEEGYRKSFAPRYSTYCRPNDNSRFYEISSVPGTPMIRLLVGTKRDTLDVRIVDMQKPSFNLLVYPNPVKEVANISYNLPTAADVVISITDLTGRTVKVENLGKQVGMNSHKLNISNLASGNYIVTVNVNGLIETKKITIAR